MIKITIDNSIYEVPSGWNEFSTEDLVALINICKKESTMIEIQLKFFLYCVYGCVTHDVGMNIYNIKTKRSRHTLRADELAMTLSVFDYIFDFDNDGNPYLSPKLTTNHFPKTQCGCTILYGPNDALDNITYNDFIWLQTWHSQMKDNIAAVDELINVLYKQKSGKQDVSILSKMSPTVKTATLWLYIGTLQLLSERFPHVFGGVGSELSSASEVFDNQQRIIDSFAQGDVTKKEQVRCSLLYDALYSMEMAAIRQEEMEDAMNKNN